MKFPRITLIGAALALCVPLVAVSAPSNDEAGSHDPMTPSRMMPNVKWSGIHVVHGQIRNVDHDTGYLQISAGNLLDLHFPPNAIENVYKGDSAAIELAYATLPEKASMRTPPGTSASQYENAEPEENQTASQNFSGKERAGWVGEHTMKGTVTETIPSAGAVYVNTHEGDLQLHFSSTSLAQLHNGDHILVYLALKPSG